MKTITELYTLKSLTPLHVGEGNSNYGVIDKEVQRDAISNMPMVHASSFKGALRTWSMHHMDSDQDVKVIFGPEKNDDTSIMHAQQYKFYDSHLVAIPIRSNIVPYFMATTPAVLKEVTWLLNCFQLSHLPIYKCLEKASTLSFDEGEQAYVANASLANACLEKHHYKTTFKANKLASEMFDELSRFFGSPLAIVNHSIMAHAAKHLPIQARNKLDNGESKNLWFEEQVPRQSLFVSFIERPETNTTLGDHLIKQNGLIQIGANATVGQGLCQLISHNN